MKDQVKEYERQKEKLDEIFGWLRRSFGSQPSQQSATSVWHHQDTDADCSPYGIKQNTGDKLNRKVAGQMGQANITIGNNTIKNIKGLEFEILDSRGKGTGSYVHAVVRDFKCYDEEKDIYGIKWLFDTNASYEAESITGRLKANKKPQQVDFRGKWKEGEFKGNFMSAPENFGPTATIDKKIATFSFGAPLSVSKTATRKKTNRPKRKANKSQKPSTQTSSTPPSSVIPMTPVSSIAPQKAGSVQATNSGKGGKSGNRGKMNFKESLTIKEFLKSFL